MELEFINDDIYKARKKTARHGFLTKLIITLSGGKIKSKAATTLCFWGVILICFIVNFFIIRQWILPPSPEPILSPYDS